MAPEVDQLLWRVAEEGDPKAVADFEARFPDLRIELYKRLEMVRGLRGGQKVARAARRDIPTFRPRTPKAAPIPTRILWVTAVLVLATLGLASFLVTLNMNPALPVRSSQPETTTQPTPPQTTDDQKFRPSTPTIPDSVRNPGLVAKPEGPVPKWQARQNFNFEDMDISVALQVVGQLGGLQVELAPNMPQARVSKDYIGKTAIEVLSDLAHEYGFTYFEQGKGKILVIPAVESNPTDRSTDTMAKDPSDAPTSTSGG